MKTQEFTTIEAIVRTEMARAAKQKADNEMQEAKECLVHQLFNDGRYDLLQIITARVNSEFKHIPAADYQDASLAVERKLNIEYRGTK